MDRRRPNYINNTTLKVAAFIHLLVGSIILIISGVVLFTLPSFAFYLVFLFGLYLFVPGVIITFGLVPRRAAQSWGRFLIPIWRWFN